MSQDTQPSLLSLLSHGDVHFYWNQLQCSIIISKAVSSDHEILSFMSLFYLVIYSYYYYYN